MSSWSATETDSTVESVGKRFRAWASATEPADRIECAVETGDCRLTALLSLPGVRRE